MDETERNKLLESEYFHLQRVVEEFDQRALTIKAWSVTFSAAGLGLAYSESERAIPLVASLSAIVFWIVESLWKTNQQAYYPRIGEIEAHFSLAESLTMPLAIKRSWSESWRQRGKYGLAFHIMRWPHVALPHVFVVVAGLLLFLLFPPGPSS